MESQAEMDEELEQPELSINQINKNLEFDQTLWEKADIRKTTKAIKQYQFYTRYLLQF